MLPETVPFELKQFVEQEVASGNFSSEEEAISEGLNLLREKKLYELQKEIGAGLDQMDRGEVVRIPSEEAHRAFFDAIKARGRARLESKGIGA